MQKMVTVLIALGLISSFCIEDGFSTDSLITGEVMFDSVAYHAVPLEDTSMLKYPGDYCSVRIRSPKVIKQDTFSICASTAEVNAFTMLRAIDCGLAGKGPVELVRHSTAFLHWHIVQTIDGITGARMEDGFNFLQNTGVCFEKSYPFSSALDRKPGKKAYSEASNCKIAYYKRLFDTTSELETKISQVQKMLMQCVPVIVVLWTTDDFSAFKGHCWYPERLPRKGELHAVVVTGYNEYTQEFELLNSYGEDWGEDGFFYMNEVTFARYTHGAYYMSLGQFPPPCGP